MAGSLKQRLTVGLTVGLTGGIGSGKSTVAGMLQVLGAELVDTDAIARTLTQARGLAIAPIRDSFGARFIDASGALDRAQMRELAFTDKGARHRLEAILHPMIGAETRRREAGSTADVLVFDVPLLVESGHWRDRVRQVLVVDCAEATQLARVTARPGWSDVSARAVVAQQASRATRLACADAVLHNEGISLEELAAEVHILWQHWRMHTG